MTAAHPLHVTAECHTAPGRAPIGRVTTAVYRYPTPQPEADGTLTWDATTAVAVTLEADGRSGLGWTYSSASAADIIRHDLAGLVHGRDAYDVTAGWEAMHRAGRNLGTRGLYMQALSAVDIAWWISRPGCSTPSSHCSSSPATRCTAGSSWPGSCPRVLAGRWLRRWWT